MPFHPSLLPTPFVTVSKSALLRNMNAMSEIMQAHPAVRLRPHVKTHKCVEISKLSLTVGGASGLCFQVLDELEPHIKRILEFDKSKGKLDFMLTSSVVGPIKLKRLKDLIELSEDTTLISVLVDDVANLQQLVDLKIPIGIFIEIDVGQNRCGVNVSTSSGLQTVESLARTILDPSNKLQYRGLHAYQGALQHVRVKSERSSLVQSQSVATAAKVNSHLLSLNPPINSPLITGAGTGSFLHELSGGVHNEVQPGSYVFMDTDYLANSSPPPFEHSLWILGTVLSNATGRACCDIGSKAVDLVSGVPKFTNGMTSEYLTDVVYESGGDEHGVLNPTHPNVQAMSVGDLVYSVPCHIDPTVNLHSEIAVIGDSGDVEDIWEIHRSCGR
ncbi:hypothetical protein TrST_g6247 [Triparma strigata]|uniref:D-serine dehydratase-like domain-containing protein n=1 Tax=Triparma strigata TaxID=1606541 RepID=A0A9W7ERF4_9STRA|nr:hypothetical protein TrST_g6247 [Triparma strigata]